MQNRGHIIEGAAELFRNYGIRSVTMDSLANHLGISKRTIYEIFADKDELLLGVFQWMSEKQQEMVKKFMDESGNAIIAIFKLMEMTINHFQGMSPAFQADMKKYYHEEILNKSNGYQMPDISYTIPLIEKGIREKLFRKDINPDLVNRCMYLLGKSVMDQDLYSSGQFTRHEVIQNTLINYLRGISTKEGNELISKLAEKI